MGEYWKGKTGKNAPNWKGGVTITKERLKERLRYYRQKPECKLKRRLFQAKRIALKKSTADDTVTKENIEKLLIEQNNKCVLCKVKLEKYHIDHKIPLSKGGKHTIKNIQLLCPKCNVLKSNH